MEENPVFDGLGWMVNSDRESFDGLFGDEAKETVTFDLEEEGSGTVQFEYRLKDWLLSRQRFWGPHTNGPLSRLRSCTC